VSGSHLILLVEDDGLRRDLPPALPSTPASRPGPTAAAGGPRSCVVTEQANTR